ncbi:corepressor interacting with RBPJ 1 isoform X1 [Aplysia californica]|uniref:Corepressor interacting with RBPJ 1 isoform X1 n=1 Tax=Aplysia californica TaxID=6500 RepID=A0ABM1VVT9_APLCA|nr:corepressor interacting with RBPJ 1 isoform X1 [Aplysia californica]
MGKGFNDYMAKKFFLPSNKENQKRKWIAEQKTTFEKKQLEDLLAQYKKEQDVLSNRALLGDEKAKLRLSILYDAPPGLKKNEAAKKGCPPVSVLGDLLYLQPAVPHMPEICLQLIGQYNLESERQQQEVKFEWQRKYNAPREAYAKDDDTIRDQPFGIEVKNVRCIKCRQWGHVNTDKICPLYSRNLTAEPEMPETSSSSILDGLREDGFAIKDSVLGRMMGSEPERHHKI